MSYSGFGGSRSQMIYAMALQQQQQAAAAAQAKEAAAKEAAAKEAAAAPPMQQMAYGPQMGPYQEAFTPAQTGGALPVIILAVIVLAVIGGGTFFLYKKLKGEKEEEWEWEEEEAEPEIPAPKIRVAAKVQAAPEEIAPKLPARRRRRR